MNELNMDSKITENKKVKKTKKQDHVALSLESVKKINSWIKQAEQKKKGVSITRKDFINWLIEKSPDQLVPGDLSALVDRFYDEAKFLRQLLRELNQAKAEGKTDTGFEVVVKTKKKNCKNDSSINQEHQASSKQINECTNK